MEESGLKAMTCPNKFTARFISFNKMYSNDLREQSFVDWPFREECKCTPKMMAKAGFVHCPGENEPDVACCFFCQLELEGWEPDDDPWSEHHKHSPNCGFLAMTKDYEEMTVAEFHHMEQKRLQVSLWRSCNKKILCFQNAVEITTRNIKALFDSILV